MRSSSLTLLLASASIAAAAPFSYPLANGFPNLNATALQEIFKLAGGTTPNSAPPTSLKADGVQALQLIAANELFEVAYFTELLHNITTHVSGYEAGHDRYTIETLTAVVNQEQVHVLSANGVLAHANETTIQPCEYDFPVATFHDAIALAQTFTDVVLGVLPAAQSVFSADGGDEAALIPVVGAIIGQEGEQNGYYRALQQKVASAAPFLTGGAPQFAYSAISQFIVPGSCPNIDAIGLTAFPPLTLEAHPKARNKNGTLQFLIQGSVTAANASVVYISGQNLPVTVPISIVSNNSTAGETRFSAPFPYDVGFDRGLTIAALVGGAGASFGSAADVAAATINGPALIEVD